MTFSWMALIFNNNKKEQPRTECLWDSCWYAGVDDDSIEISFEHYDDETVGVNNCTKEEENDEFDDERVIDDDDIIMMTTTNATATMVLSVQQQRITIIMTVTLIMTLKQRRQV